MTESRASGVGELVIVATPIGNLGDLSPRAVEVLGSADVIACEDTRRTRKLLTHAGIAHPSLLAVHEHNEASQVPKLLGRLQGGERIALVSDAGMPGIADPGERLVRAAIDAGVPVGVVPGPSAAVAALVVSGLPTGRFCFEGFLPRKGSGRTERLAAVAAEPRTSVLYEAPHRIRQTIADLASACGGDRQVVIVRELTKLFEETWRGTLGEAVEWLAGVEPRGELALVLAGAPPAEPATADDVESALRARLDMGTTKKDAVAVVARDLGVPKREVYEVATRL